MTTTTLAATTTDRLPCKCGTRLAVNIVTRTMGRAKSYRAKCQGCGKESASTFYLERVDDLWNEVATR